MAKKVFEFREFEFSKSIFTRDLNDFEFSNFEFLKSFYGRF